MKGLSSGLGVNRSLTKSSELAVALGRGDAPNGWQQVEPRQQPARRDWRPAATAQECRTET